MDWSNERYVRAYVRDTVAWLALPWQGRALFWEVLRKVDRAGVLDLGKHDVRGLADLVRMPVDVVEGALAALLSDGCVERHGDALVVPRFIEAQEAIMGEAARQRESRCSRRDRLRAGLPEPQRAAVVYLAQSEDGGPVKVAHTDDLARRLVALNASRPDRLVVIAAAPGTAADERALHQHFAPLRQRGEWFAPDPALLAFAAHMSAKGAAAFPDVVQFLPGVTNRDVSRTVTCHENDGVTPYRALPSVQKNSPLPPAGGREGKGERSGGTTSGPTPPAGTTPPASAEAPPVAPTPTAPPPVAPEAARPPGGLAAVARSSAITEALSRGAGASFLPMGGAMLESALVALAVDLALSAADLEAVGVEMARAPRGDRRPWTIPGLLGYARDGQPLLELLAKARARRPAAAPVAPPRPALRVVAREGAGATAEPPAFVFRSPFVRVGGQ